MSESNSFNARWRRNFCGEHDARLQAVKRRYDPEVLFLVHHGAGSEAWSADGFTHLS
ncbi:MAG: BBE domain-containing protein [Gammaproteobacteria bacterium]|nr:BBE domain-containing protein [Gammaproteobacteria bacterium]